MSITDYADRIKPLLQQFGVKRAAIYGSIAKGTSNNQSDLDLLIEPSGNFSLFNLLELENRISVIISRPVDIVEYSSIKNSIRKEVLNSAVPIL